MDKNRFNGRFILIFVLLAIFAFVCIFRLFNLQIVNGDEYKEKAENRLIRASAIKAPRGEIVDRYGVPLVSNSMGFYVLIQKIDNDDEQLNRTIAALIDFCRQDGAEYFDEFPISSPPYKFKFDGSNSKEKINEWLKDNNLKKNLDAKGIIDHYIEKYNVSEEHDEKTARDNGAVRYMM